VPLLPVVFPSHFTPRLKANILTLLYTHSHNLTSLIIKLAPSGPASSCLFSFD